jgi:hypothetical protein
MEIKSDLIEWLKKDAGPLPDKESYGTGKRNWNLNVEPGFWFKGKPFKHGDIVVVTHQPDLHDELHWKNRQPKEESPGIIQYGDGIWGIIVITDYYAEHSEPRMILLGNVEEMQVYNSPQSKYTEYLINDYIIALGTIIGLLEGLTSQNYLPENVQNNLKEILSRWERIDKKFMESVK